VILTPRLKAFFNAITQGKRRCISYLEKNAPFFGAFFYIWRYETWKNRAAIIAIIVEKYEQR